MLTTEEKVKNIFAFLSILFGENLELSTKILDMPPDYLIEKFERYIESTRYEADSGLHLTLRRSIFDQYCEKYYLTISA